MSSPYYNGNHAHIPPEQRSTYSSLSGANPTPSRPTIPHLNHPNYNVPVHSPPPPPPPHRIQVPPPASIKNRQGSQMLANWNGSTTGPGSNRVLFDHPGNTGRGIFMRHLDKRPLWNHVTETISNAAEPMDVFSVLGGGGPEVGVDLKWPGYDDVKYGSNSRGSSSSMQVVSKGRPLARGELACKIAERYSQFFAKLQRDREVGTYPEWRVGPAAPITFDSLVLVKESSGGPG
ncbi:hypothetical protein BDV98DRAFT_582483 [Pterulicium gracile]|uniref:Uncharacterized protein n=1 Tax=Pterulicium gracile TaxID=1884261 RepID=A0A5C3QNS6_9AGAR|nr:hypothetical protein BDV98DRAFT_582483 [Pterula gracilis]